MPYITRPSRQTDYNQFPSTTPIVIDNGSSTFRIGWAGESKPRISFRNLVQRPRHKSTGETVTIVGDADPTLMKYFDCTRSTLRSAFDSNVVYQFETMEYILDYGFERLGVNGHKVDHPVLITECALNPVQSRTFGVGAAFSYKYNQQLGICDKDGLLYFVAGEPVLEGCCRTNVGGYHVTDYFKQLLSLKYPHHMNIISWEKAEELKREHCYVSQDYAPEVQLFQISFYIIFSYNRPGDKTAEEKSICWQLPWVPPQVEAAPSAEEIARKAAIREKQGQRLRDMAAAKKSSKIIELENELQGLEFLLQQLSGVEEADIPSFLSATGYVSKQEIESAIAKVTQSLRKTKGEQVEMEEKAEPSYPLIDVPDNMLTQDQLKEKRRQLFLKTTSEGRQRAKQKRSEQELQNPELYLEQLNAKHKELSEKVEQRKRLKTNGSRPNGNQNPAGGVGRGERLNAAKKERMRLLTTAAFDRGKGEDTFGAREEDWQLYKLMSKDNDDDEDEQDEDEAELARITSRLQDIDPSFVAKVDVIPVQPAAELPKFRPTTKEDFQIIIGVERIRCPEILFQPNMVGIDQSGLDEMVGVSMRRLPTKGNGVEDRITSSILITGGSCLFPGMAERLEAGIRMIRPFQSPIRIVMASDPVLDAWRGASAYAASSQFSVQTFTREDYYEKGEDWLRKYQLRYSL
ncbi:hypothetical protein MKW92_053720 [Papaver armeniacum]|nr:hypothetical protein MKW92_053720 [Papaver armeniacum]